MLSPGELAMLDGERNLRMMLAVAPDEQTRQAVLDAWDAMGEHLSKQQRMERSARPVDVGAEFFADRTNYLMRQRSHVPL